MSLIQAALDKAEKNPTGEAEKNPLTTAAPQTQKQQPGPLQAALMSQAVKESLEPSFLKPAELRKFVQEAKKSNSRPSPVFYLLLGSLTLVVFMLIFFRSSFHQKKVIQPTPAVEIPESFVPISERSKSLPGLTPGPKLVLSGITSFGENEYLALINNQIVAEGDVLKERALVKKIQNRSVLLEFRGKETTLSL